MFISSFIKFQEQRTTFEEMLIILDLIFETLSSFIKVCALAMLRFISHNDVHSLTKMHDYHFTKNFRDRISIYLFFKYFLLIKHITR